VAGVHALVAEDAAHLVNPVHAADHQPLQVQLRLDAQEHVDVQRVVVGDEGARRRADLQRAQDRGVHLEEAARVEEIPDGADDPGPLDEGVLDLGVDDEVQIPLTVAKIRVLQAVEFLRQRVQALGEQHEARGVHRDFAGFGAEHRAGDAEHVAQVEVLEVGVGLIAHVVPANVDLNPAVRVLQVREAGLAHHAAGDHAPGHGHRLALQRIIIGKNLPGGMGLVKAGDGVGTLADRRQRPNLADSNLALLGRVLRRPGEHIGHQKNPSRLCANYKISSTFSRITPLGACASTTSPGFAPISALPMGDSVETQRSSGRASVAPTTV